MMKLSELHPRWVLIHRWDDANGTQHFTNGDSSQRHGGGVTFDCPVHRDHRLCIWFENPIDGLPPEATAKCLWRREGDTFEMLTLSPSIDATGWHPGCWHGFITNGIVR